MNAHLVTAVIDEFSLNDFTEKEHIGSGGGGEAFRGYNDQLGKVAFKRLYGRINKTDINEVILLVKYSNHPNIIRLFGLLTPEEGYSPNNKPFYNGYIMEYMENGSLFDVIHNTSVEYDMKQVYSWIEMASSGLKYLHEKNIMHRDIKPKNILLGKSLDDLRISDFGLAKPVEPQAITSLTGGIGSVDYMAPELYIETKYDKSVDIYALTITFWEIIHRERPYGYMGVITPFVQIHRILNGARPNIQEELEISALLKRGWDNNPKSRPQISEFIAFSRKAQENLRKVVSQQNVNQIENNVEKQSGGQQNTSVLILGGKGGLSKIYLFDSKVQSWKQIRITLPVGMEGFGAVVVNEELYIFGGFLNEKWQKNCYKFNGNENCWYRLESLNQQRDNIANNCLVYKGDIWVIGGYCEKALKSVEKYDISQNKWTYMPALNYERHSSASANYKDRIFVTGGKNKAELKSVEIFDPILQKWILFCDLPFSLHGHTMLINNSIISIFGGKSITLGRLNVEWEMDIEDSTRELKQIRNFKYTRMHFGIAKLSNETILFGDWGGADNKSEIFDGNNWIDGPKLPQKCIFSAYSVIPRSLEERFLTKFS